MRLMTKGGARLLWVGACLCVLAACGDQVPVAPASQDADLCLNDFQTCVMPVLSGQIRRRGGAVVSCMDGNCHVAGGNGGRFTLGADVSANFEAVKSNFVNFASTHESLILVEPTQDDVSPSAAAAFHGGGEIFPSRSDACYVAIHDWMSNQVVNQSSAACGLCAPIADTFASCGY
jgi:hypothetical protein